MRLINWKVGLKLKWAKYFVLSSASADNVNNRDSHNIILIIKDTKLYVPVVTLPARDNQKLSKLLSKVFERSVYWNEHKTKSDNKNTTNEFGYFLESNFVGVHRLFVLVYANHGDNAKSFNVTKYYLQKGIIKHYNVIVSGKNFCDQTFDSDIKRYAEIRKLTTGQHEDCTTGCLLDYDYIKNHYRLISVDLSRQNELDADGKAIQMQEIKINLCLFNNF